MRNNYERPPTLSLILLVKCEEIILQENVTKFWIKNKKVNKETEKWIDAYVYGPYRMYMMREKSHLIVIDITLCENLKVGVKIEQASS